MKRDKHISIAKDFSKFPAGRYFEDGPYSGQLFRTSLLAPALREALQSGHKVVVDLNGTPGFGSSFLEEAFGGLVRSEGFTAAQIRSILDIVSDDPTLIPSIEKNVSEAVPDVG